jgi:hypothetical protein
MRVLLHGGPYCPPSREGTGENLHQLACAIIGKPLDAPLAGYLAILENLGWLNHS